ncbi:MAG: hypothetical protein GXY13_04790 [Acidimicrobiales bacterium]|nr:hypothetical protein [Acidimicrobiales bacterium]
MSPALDGPRTGAAWAVEVLTTAPAGVRALVPGAPVPAALREDVLVAVARAQGARAMAWVHDEWRAFAGSVPDGDVRLALAHHAEACARAGHPVEPDALLEVLPADAVRGVRAVVARGRFEAEVEVRLRRVVAALVRRRVHRGLLVDVPFAAVGVAFAAPAVVVGTTLGVLARAAPPVPVVEGADDPEVGLLGALAAEAVPVLLGNAAVRAVVIGSPFVISVGLRSGASGATVSIGRGRARVTDGVDPAATVILQGDVEPLVRLAAGVVLREAHDFTPLP